MNQDAVINRLAHITDASRKQIIDALKQMGSIPDVRKELDKHRHGKR